MKLPRFHFSTAQLLLLTALVALGIALATAVYQRVRSEARPVGAAYSADGQLAAVRFSNGGIRVWNDRGRPLATLNTGQIWAIWTSTPTLAVIDEQHLATTNGAGEIEIWQIEQEQRIGKFGSTFPSPYWETCSISADGRRVASIRVGAQRGVDIWDVQRGVRAATLKTPSLPQRVVLSADGSRLAVIGHGGGLNIYDVATGERTAGPFQLLANSVSRDTIALSGDMTTVAVHDDRFYADSEVTSVVVFDITASPSAMIVQPSDFCQTLALSHDGELLATATPDGAIEVWNTSDGQKLGSLALPIDDSFLASLDLAQSPAVAMSFSPDGKSLLAATSGAIGIYDLPSLKRRANLGIVPSRLGRWFFMAAFAVWSILWGIAARRKASVSPARRAGSVSSLNPPSMESASPAEEAAIAIANPPRALVAVWIMMFLGGVWAIAWSMLIIFSDLTCLALTPFPYIGLYVGLRATAAGAGRAGGKFNLPGVALLQMAGFFAGDLLNPPLGLANLLLLQRPAVKQYLARGMLSSA